MLVVLLRTEALIECTKQRKGSAKMPVNRSGHLKFSKLNYMHWT